MTYGLLFWGTDVDKIFILQKQAVRYLAGLGPRDSCRQAFRDLKIMTLASAHVHENIVYAFFHCL